MTLGVTAFTSLRSGNLEARLASTRAEVKAAQELRYCVFYEEMGARPTPAMATERRDFDDFDEICDHLLVIDHTNGEQVVGTYRLTRREQADRFGRFYTASEFDISPILGHHGRVLELGRSCVAANYRTTMTMNMLWRAIAAYVTHHGIEIMFGCASLPGTEPEALALPLSYLVHHHLAPEHLRARALPPLYTEMRRLPAEAVDARAGLAALPPLVKGYLRLGGFFGDGAVIDRQFNTTDVCVIVKTERVAEKYMRHYDRTIREARLG